MYETLTGPCCLQCFYFVALTGPCSLYAFSLCGRRKLIADSCCNGAHFLLFYRTFEKTLLISHNKRNQQQWLKALPANTKNVILK